MANDEHVALLKQGVDAWNAWRRYNPDIRPDLSEANLSGADLRRAVRRAREEAPALRREAGVVETVTPPAPAPARSQRSRRTTQAATTVTGFHRFTVAVSIAARAPSVK
jgi:hypothetical protein